MAPTVGCDYAEVSSIQARAQRELLGPGMPAPENVVTSGQTARTVHQPPHPLQRRSHKLLRTAGHPVTGAISSVSLWAWLEGWGAMEALGPQLQLLWVSLLPRFRPPRVIEIVERGQGAKPAPAPLAEKGRIGRAGRGGLLPAAQWLGLCTFNGRSAGSIPGPGTKIPHALQCGQKAKVCLFVCF